MSTRHLSGPSARHSDPTPSGGHPGIVLLLGATVVCAAPSTWAGDLAPGDPIDSPERAATVAELVRVADAIDRAVDAKAWDVAGALFTETIDVDFTSLVGGEPATIPSSALIDGWSTNLKASKTSFHQRSNHLVTFDGEDRATMTSAGYAWNRMEAGAEEANGGEPLWEVWGVYTHDFERVDGDWRVDSMKLDVTNQRGNEWVRDTVPDA